MKEERRMVLIGQSESTTIEWKPSLSQINEIIESIAAFANTEGGRLFIGVSRDGKAAGVSIGKDTIENLANRIAQHTEPKVHPRITVVKVEGKDIIIMDVKESHDKLVLAGGKPYIRVGKSTRQMGKDEYERRILDKHKDKLQFDTQVCKGAKLADIDSGKVKWFLEKAKEARGFDVPERMSVKETLERLDFLVQNKPTNTAILLFGKRPQKFFVQAAIRCGRIKGTEGNDFLDMKVLEGAIPELRGNTLKFITEHIKHAVYFDANQRYDKWEYPLRALEEVLNNALAHRDYFSNADIQLFIYDDRIEVWNPGELIKPLTLADLKRKHRSIPRNKFLAAKLFLIKYIEHWGMGTNRIVGEMKENGLPEPEFQNLSGGFEVTLRGPGKAFEKEIERQKLHKLDISERQRKAIGFVSKKGHIRRADYIEINGVSHTIAHRELRDLVKKGIFAIKGAGKYLRYELTQG